MSQVVPFHLTRPKRHEEDALHKQITNYFRWSLPADACWLPIPNGGFRWKSEGERMKGQGMVRAGAPDLLVVYEGQALFIELKTPTGTLSTDQRQMHQKLVDAGADVFVCRSLPEVIERLSEAGVRLRGKLG